MKPLPGETFREFFERSQPISWTPGWGTRHQDVIVALMNAVADWLDAKTGGKT